MIVRIVALSDTHCLHDQVTNLPDGDILVHAGDFTGRGGYKALMKFAAWLSKQKDKYAHRVVIAGNHDFGLQDHPVATKALFDSKVIYLENQSRTICGLKFWGSPYTLPFYRWAFMADENTLAEMYSHIPEDTQVLITHGPPRGILDKSSRGEHCGSEALYERIKQLPNLKVHIFGHIHEGHGQEEIEGVRFYNVAVLNDQYHMIHQPTVIEVENE